MLTQVRRFAQRAMKGLFRSEGQEGVGGSDTERASFKLLLGDLEIGSLDLAGGRWCFRYSEDFKSQLGEDGAVRPIVDFPDPNREYEASVDDLWPFFMSRIPSLSQPRVLEEIESKRIDRTSAAELLRAFGERSIANPFVLRPA